MREPAGRVRYILGKGKTVGGAYDVRRAEAQATAEMKRHIGCHLAYLDKCYQLLELATGHYDDCETRVGSVDYVALLLFGRIANDVRAIWSLARLGYGVQACALAAGVLEHAFTFVDTIIDDQRAAKWSTYAEPRYSFLSAGQAIEKFVCRMPWSSERKIEAKRRQCIIYQELCQFKHGNPSGIFPRPNDAGYCDNRLGPDTTDFGICSASVAVLHAGWCAGLTVYQWVDARPLPTAVRDHFEEQLGVFVEQHELLTEKTRILLDALEPSR